MYVFYFLHALVGFIAAAAGASAVVACATSTSSSAHLHCNGRRLFTMLIRTICRRSLVGIRRRPACARVQIPPWLSARLFTRKFTRQLSPPLWRTLPTNRCRACVCVCAHTSVCEVWRAELSSRHERDLERSVPPFLIPAQSLFRLHYVSNFAPGVMRMYANFAQVSLRSADFARSREKSRRNR